MSRVQKRDCTSRGGELSRGRTIVPSVATKLGRPKPGETGENSVFAFSVSVVGREVAGGTCSTWQQATRDCAFITLSLWGMAIPLHRAWIFELWPEQSRVLHREPGAAITTNATTNVVSLCQEIRICALRFIAYRNNFVTILCFVLAASCVPRHRPL